DRIVELINNALFQGNYRIVRDVYIFGANFGTAFGYVAKANARLIFHEGGAVHGIELVHLQPGKTHEKARTHKGVLAIVITQNVANVLAEEALDTLAKFLDGLDIFLVDDPLRIRLRGKRHDSFVDLEVPGDICHQVLDHRKRLDRLDSDLFVVAKAIHAGLAHERRTPVDLGTARATLSRLAVPAHGQIRLLMALNVVNGIEHNHSLFDRHLIGLELAAVLVSAKNLQRRFTHWLFPSSSVQSASVPPALPAMVSARDSFPRRS